jgi:hypothetical protein
MSSVRISVELQFLQLKVTFDGFRLVIIGDLHEQPMLHIKTKPFELRAKDWSGEVCLEIFHEAMTLIAK